MLYSHLQKKTERNGRRLPNKSKECNQSIEKVMKSYNFKTITADNGSEFLDFKSVEMQDLYTSYGSWERGGNENASGIIRRFFPKALILQNQPKANSICRRRINNYPRKILGGISANSWQNKYAPRSNRPCRQAYSI